MGQRRCPDCQRLVIGDMPPGSAFLLAPLKPHLVLLLKAAREFDAITPDGERYSAVDFVDSLALSVVGHVKPAGSPGRKRPSRATAA